MRAEGETATIAITGPLQPPGFFPAVLTVHVNDYVVFVNQSSPAATFSVTAGDGSFSSPAIGPGKQWTVALNNPGEYEYHTTSSSQSMVGEILVVAASISLLQTPDPAIQATAIAIIEAGKIPPDSLALPTPTPASSKSSLRTLPLAGSWLVSPLIPIESAIILLCLVIAAFLLIRSHQRRLQKSNEAGLTQIESGHKWFRWLKRRKDEDSDDDEDIDV